MKTTTVRLKGEGGSIFTFDLPLHPNVSKQLARGELRPADEKSAFLLEPPDAEEPEDSDPPEDPHGEALYGEPQEDPGDPAGIAAHVDMSASVPDIVAAVDEDPDVATAVLEAELSHDKPRTTLVEALGEIVSMADGITT